jgi:hydroxypyruvate isomerase
MSNQSTRRDAIKKFAAATVALTAGNAVSGGTIERIMEDDHYKLKGNINHSVCKWTHDFLSLEELCVEVKKMGFSAIDLLTPSEWPIAKKHGIHVSMCYTNGKVSLTEGWNNKKKPCTVDCCIYRSYSVGGRSRISKSYLLQRQPQWYGR